MDREYQGACSVNLHNDRAERDHGDKYPSLYIYISYSLAKLRKITKTKQKPVKPETIVCL